MCVASVSFNGATAMKPWKSRPMAMHDHGIDGFNGATAMKPWKSMDSSVPGSATAIASMGPRR